MNWKTGFVIVMLLLVPAALMFADVVHMSDGRKIKGKIISETDDNVVLEGKYGKVTLRRDEIDRIERGPVEEKEEPVPPKKGPKPPKPAPKKRPRPKRRGTEDLYSLADKAATGDAQAAKKLVAAKRAALIPIVKKIEELEGAEKERLEKLYDEIEEKTQPEKEQAEKLYKEAAELQKQCVALQKELGNNPTPEQKRNADKLLNAFSGKLIEAFELDPANTSVMESVAKMAGMYYKGNAYSRAIPLLETLHAHVPDNKDVMERLASSYMNLRKYKEAKKFLEKILEKDPKNRVAWANMGAVHNAEKKYDEAIKAFEKAISLGLTEADVYDYLGTAYKYKKNWDKAIENFEKCREKDNKHGNALFQLGALYANKGEYKKAIERWEKFCELCPNPDVTKQVKKEIKKLKKRAEKEKK